ncbi:MAG: aminoacyl-tRNA hydrolase [Erysipelothrix sp.]|nr:aminoacyl-tRNA hydrolase [Erysipelothrix sp.]
MKLIVGIGNPGKEYENTRHNVGFLAVDKIADHHNVEFDQKKFNSVYAILRIKGQRVILMKPETYVNLSGSAVLSMMNYFGIDKDEILIIYDDFALPLGKIRVRFKGSGGGHNGLINIIEYLKTQNFKRMRIGIDSNPLIENKNYVLGRFNKDDQKVIDETLKKLVDVPKDLINYSFSDFMNKYNKEM